MLTNSKDRAISFKVGLDGRIPLPGYVIPVADELLAGRAVGGRISAVAGRVITLDRDTQAKAGDRLILNLPNGKCEGRTVQLVSGRAVTVTTAYSMAPEPQLVWALDAPDLAIPLYRVTSVSRPEPGVFEITAIQYDPSKFAHIDTGARLEERPISVIPISVVPAPASVTLTSNSAVDQGLAVTTMTIAWPSVAGAVGYDVEWRKDNGNWVKLPRTGALGVDVVGIYAGAYLARVRAVSAFEISSVWKDSLLTQLNGKVGLPPAVSYLTTTSLLFGIGQKWGFPAGAEDTQRTEVWYGPTPNIASATKLADLSYPQSEHSMQSLQAGAQFFFWARLVDRTGNIGPFYPTGAGVMGQASSDAGPILEQIKGQVDESALGQHLKDRIDLIDGPQTLPGSVNSRIKELNDDLQEQIDAIGDIVDALEYDTRKTYIAGDSVRQGQRLYQAIGPVPINKPPPNAAYWLDVGQIVKDSNGLAARVTTSETKITSIEGVNTAQSTAITGLQTSLTTTNGNVTAAQNAANAANTLAGGKGKVLVQTATPAAADQLVQNLWIDITGGANTPKRWSGTAWVAVTDKVATDAAAAAANALALATTKADASAVQSLTTRVTSAEGTISSQGTAITGLNNSLTTTNTNVTAAQNAANAANTLAGGKGKVIVQAAAPAVADRLAQNLWIDITGGANTPKRWTGSVWEPVTDKVATDAAAAAASALIVANTKADASAVTSLSNTVTQQGNTIAAQGTAVTGLTNRIANAEGVNTAQSEAITQIDSKVTEIDGKATSTAAAFNALRSSWRGDDDGNGSKVDALKGWASTAAIANEEKTRASENEAIAQRTTTLDAKVGDNAANLTTLEKVVATNELAMSQSLVQLSAEVGDNKAAVQQTTEALAETNGKLSTLWSVKMEATAGGQLYAASFGLGLQVDPSGVSSQFVVRADTFMLLNLVNGTPVSPFSVTGGQTFIRSAFIQDGTITNAKIGGALQSTDYVAGLTGWILPRTGPWEMNGYAPGQGRMTMSNGSIRFYHPNGVLGIDLSI